MRNVIPDLVGDPLDCSKRMFAGACPELVEWANMTNSFSIPHTSFPSILRRYVLELVVVAERAAKEVSARTVVFCNKVKSLGVGWE